jgi:hypothetical protein
MAQIATIQLRIATREQLKRLGRKGESYNDIIEALMIEHSGNPAIDSHPNRISTTNKQVACRGGSSQE